MEAAESCLYHFVRGREVLQICKSDIFIDFDPFSGDFSKLQQIPRNSVGLPYGFLSVVFRVVTVGESVNSLFW